MSTAPAIPFTFEATRRDTAFRHDGEETYLDTAVILARVAEGAEFLDAILPGWRDLIDADSLNVASICSCVRGQLVGPYRERPTAELVMAAIEAFNEPLTAAWSKQPTPFPVALGMDIEALSDYPEFSDEQFEILTEAWQRAVRGQDIFDI